MTTETKTLNSFETEVETCAHRVAIRWWDIEAELTDELREELTEAGEERAHEMIASDGYVSGELCYQNNIAGSDEDGEEMRGWWEIIND